MSRKTPGLFLALLSGALTALAFPKFNLSFLAWISLVPLFFVLSRSRPKQAFWNGLAAGVAFYGVLLYWIPDVPSHYGDLPMWLSVIIFLILILFLAGYWALFSLSFTAVRQAFPAAAYILAPFLWVSFEYAMTYSRKMTFYTKHGDVLAWASLTLSIIFFIMRIFINTREREHHGPKRAVH